MFINLGSGLHPVSGYTNVDKYASFAPDVCHDLEIVPWPFPNQCADRIMLIHVLEHLGQRPDVFLCIMKELYRIAKPGCEIKITVPHPRSDDFLGDPTHVRPITVDTMAMFSMAENDKWKELGAANTPLAYICGVDFTITSCEYLLTDKWSKLVEAGVVCDDEIKAAMQSEYNVAREITIYMMRV